MTARARVYAYGSCGVLVLLGVASGIASNGLVGDLLEFILIAFGFVFALGLVFYEVGLSEDRERAREERAARAKANPRPARPRFRLDRARGRPRRLGG